MLNPSRLVSRSRCVHLHVKKTSKAPARFLVVVTFWRPLIHIKAVFEFDASNSFRKVRKLKLSGLNLLFVDECVSEVFWCQKWFSRKLFLLLKQISSNWKKVESFCYLTIRRKFIFLRHRRCIFFFSSPLFFDAGKKSCNVLIRLWPSNSQKFQALERLSCVKIKFWALTFLFCKRTSSFLLGDVWETSHLNKSQVVDLLSVIFSINGQK